MSDPKEALPLGLHADNGDYAPLWVGESGEVRTSVQCVLHGDKWSPLTWDGARLAPRCCLDAARTALREELIYELRAKLADLTRKP